MLALRVYLGGYSRNHHRGYCADIETGLMPMRRCCDCNLRSFDSGVELAAAVMTQFAIAANCPNEDARLIYCQQLDQSFKMPFMSHYVHFQVHSHVDIHRMF